MRKQEKISDLMTALNIYYLREKMGFGSESRATTVSVEFEVRGEIQGLYFLKHCREEADRHGILGWVKHSRRGTIVGAIQGSRAKVEQMIYWLSTKGSPGSRIESCDLYNYQYISRPEFRSFNVRY